MTIHYNNALRPEENSCPICHPGGSGHRSTTDIERVTCRRCLRILGKGGKR